MSSGYGIKLLFKTSEYAVALFFLIPTGFLANFPVAAYLYLRFENHPKESFKSTNLEVQGPASNFSYLVLF